MRDQKGKDLQLGMAALEHARAGGQSNITPEMASALIERMAYLRELCGRAATAMLASSGAVDVNLAEQLSRAEQGKS